MENFTHQLFLERVRFSYVLENFTHYSLNVRGLFSYVLENFIHQFFLERARGLATYWRTLHVNYSLNVGTKFGCVFALRTFYVKWTVCVKMDIRKGRRNFFSLENITQFFKNSFYKNHKAQICKILRIS